MKSFLLLFALISSTAYTQHSYSKNGLTINTDYSGGNILIESVEGNTITYWPDLKGGRDWFYWNFEITSDKDMEFHFIVKTKSKYMGMIGMQGPAISHDQGSSWSWLGAESMTVKNREFNLSLKKGKKVRLSSTIPYMQKELDTFLHKNSSNKYLKKEILCKSTKGRDVEILTIGEAKENQEVVLFTCRHHACETMASYLLEGFIQEAISDSDAAKAFRDKYLLYVIPMVDKDGIQDGDQGKNRSPHDHNRDYLDKPLYPEVKAIKELSKTKKINIAFDWHCPTLSMDIHQGIYFPGPKDKPKNNYKNVVNLTDSMKLTMPKTGPRWFHISMKDSAKRSKAHFSNFFSEIPGVYLSATIEFPYAPKGKDMRTESCKKYGKHFLEAWIQTKFLKNNQ